MTSSGLRATAFRTADPGSKGPKITDPLFRMLFETIARTRSDWLAPSPHSETMRSIGLPAFMARTRCRALTGVSRVKTTPLMIAAGSWSLIPIQEVGKSPIRPSAVTSPKWQPASSSKAWATAARPAIQDVMDVLR